MKQSEMTRRQFTLLAGAGLLTEPRLLAGGGSVAPAGELTAAQVIDRIKQNVGVAWRSQTVDTFKAGNPDTPVKGIATSFMATLDVLKRSAASGKNLVITHEPTFYNHQDLSDGLTGDAVYRYKQDFIQKRGLVVWRFHDHWHARKPDAVFLGLAQAAGWDQHQVGDDQRFYQLPATTLGALARDLQRRLNDHTMRVVGDPKTPVSKIAVSVGYSDLMDTVQMLPQADVFIGGELREWEGVEYAQDAVASGQKKGMILLGHVVSEDPGMKLCAAWLKTFIPEVPIQWVPAGEPFWRP
jgi:putative NIF3 family GTP cyclohydrolase 1 type 2